MDLSGKIELEIKPNSTSGIFNNGDAKQRSIWQSKYLSKKRVIRLKLQEMLFLVRLNVEELA